jgi:5'-deoxynucleotidase YfbR-like HD superfamily hydrolase
MAISTFIGTRSGEFVDLVTPKAGFIQPQSVLESLCVIPRFNGHIYRNGDPRCWSDAEHSKFVEVIARVMFPGLPEWVYAMALAHDFHEAYSGDITTPMASAIVITEGQDPDIKHKAISSIKHSIQKSIMVRFGAYDQLSALETEPMYEDVVHKSDYIAFILESMNFREWHHPISGMKIDKIFKERFKVWASHQDDLGLARRWVDENGDFKFDVSVSVPDLICDFKKEMLKAFPKLVEAPSGEHDLRWDVVHMAQEREVIVDYFNLIDSTKCESVLNFVENFKQPSAIKSSP